MNPASNGWMRKMTSGSQPCLIQAVDLPPPGYDSYYPTWNPPSSGRRSNQEMAPPSHQQRPVRGFFAFPHAQAADQEPLLDSYQYQGQQQVPSMSRSMSRQGKSKGSSSKERPKQFKRSESFNLQQQRKEVVGLKQPLLTPTDPHEDHQLLHAQEEQDMPLSAVVRAKRAKQAQWEKDRTDAILSNRFNVEAEVTGEQQQLQQLPSSRSRHLSESSRNMIVVGQSAGVSDDGGMLSSGDQLEDEDDDPSLLLMNLPPPPSPPCTCGKNLDDFPPSPPQDHHGHHHGHHHPSHHGHQHPHHKEDGLGGRTGGVTFANGHRTGKTF